MNQQTIAVFGESLVDDFITEQVVGGAPFNVARNLAAFGVATLMVTRIGADKNGALVRREFERFGMTEAGLQIDALEATGRVVVERNDAGHRFIILPDQAYDYVAAAPALAALAVMSGAGRAGIANPGPHGFSEILYALTSAANNNGSAFAGLSANTPFYNTLLGIVMWLGRFGVIVPVLAIAGALAAKKRLPVTAGTMPTHGPLFVFLLMGTVLMVGLLNYVPALALGPVVEHLMLGSSK